MPPNSHSPAMQGIRDHARQTHLKKFDTIVRTLIAMDASPTDLEDRLRSVLKGNMESDEKLDRPALNRVVAEPDLGTAPDGKRIWNEGGHDPTIKVEDDEEQAKSLSDYNNTPLGNGPTTSTGQRKRKATVELGTENRRSKRLAQGRTVNHHESQKSDNVGSGGPQDPSYEPPSDADRDPTPGANTYRNENGVFVRPKVGWQFRKFNDITKVWYGGKWQPLIQDQPSFKGVREARGGWIMPIMAGSRGTSLEQRKRWEQQGKVEFNSPF